MTNSVLRTAVVFFTVLSLTSCERITLYAAAGDMGALADATQEDTTPNAVTNRRAADGTEASLLSAFYGIDDGLPVMANRGICKGAAGKDGMPVVFSHRVDLQTVQAGDFNVVAESGREGTLVCVTPAPADDSGEERTILLVGQYGNPEDPPAMVEIVGNILSVDGQMNFRGARVAVTALEEGPTIVWSEVVPETQWELGKAATALPFGGGNGCPVATKQVVRVTWAGGVTKPGGRQEVDDLERLAYRVALARDEGTDIELVPYALADLGDGDNNHELCLDRTGLPTAVTFPAGLVTDPREDLNPATRIDVGRIGDATLRR